LEATDAELVARCRNGDREAWEVVVRHRHARVYNLAYRFTGRADEAEDLTQEVFLKVYRTLHLYRAESGALETWIVRVARNHFIDHYRKHKTERHQTAPLEEHHDAIALPTVRVETPGEMLDRKETAERVHRLLDRLPHDQREAVILRDIEELTYEEIAELLKVPIGTVKSRINRGRIELARLLRAGAV
jgi:RNA polymerase sigma-70 factor (ECF subfamily)